MINGIGNSRKQVAPLPDASKCGIIRLKRGRAERIARTRGSAEVFRPHRSPIGMPCAWVRGTRCVGYLEIVSRSLSHSTITASNTAWTENANWSKRDVIHQCCPVGHAGQRLDVEAEFDGLLQKVFLPRS